MQLASNIATFFEKLTQTLDRLAKELPQYVLIVQLYETTPSTVFSDRIKTSVKQVYADLFKFFQSVTRIFTKKDGSKCPPGSLRGLANRLRHEIQTTCHI